METLGLISIFRFITGILILTYASYTDIRTRRASNMLWIIMGSIAVILLIVQYLTEGFNNPYHLIFIPIMIGLVYLLFQMRIIFGGADAKALMAIAILVPFEPSIAEFPIWKGSFMPFSWSIFQNSLIMFLIIPLSLFIFNIINRNIEFPYAFLGYRMSIKKARKTFVWPLEKIVDGKRVFSRIPKKFDSEDEWKLFEKEGISKVWVTPKVPFMIPLLIGFIFSFLFGDILFFITTFIF